jgi:hypothetical protein
MRINLLYFFVFFILVNIINKLAAQHEISMINNTLASNKPFKIDIVMILEQNFTSSLRNLSSTDSINLIQLIQNFVDNFKIFISTTN